MTEVSEKKPSKARNAQTFSNLWLKDDIKSKYASGKVGDSHFTCKICQKVF